MTTKYRRSQSIQSIAQRSVILRNPASVISVVTVPWEDLGVRASATEGTAHLKRAAFQLYGTPPSDTLGNDEYAAAIEMIQSREVWRELARDYADLYSPADERGFINVLAPGLGTFGRAMEGFTAPWDPQLVDEDPSKALARHSIVCQLQNELGNDITQSTLFPGLAPMSFILENIHHGYAVNYLEEHNVTPEAFLLAVRIHEVALRPAYRVRNALHELYEYDIPFGGSPPMENENVQHVLWRAVKAVAVRLDRAVVGQTADHLTREHRPAVLIDYGRNLVIFGSTDTPDRVLNAAASGSALQEER